MTDRTELAPIDDRAIPTEYVGKIEPNYYCRGWNAKRLKYCGSPAGSGTAHLGRGRCSHHGGERKGGDGRLTSGRYRTLKAPRVGELLADHMADADPLNMLPDVAAARALFQDFVERHAVFSAALHAWWDTWEGRFMPIALSERTALLDLIDEHEELLGGEPTEKQVEQLALARSAVAFLAAQQNPKPRRILDITDAVGHLDVISKMVARIESARSTNAISRPELLRVMTEMGRIVQAHVMDPDTLLRIRDGWLSVRL